jgi:SAM-dependent methyltransferase
MTMLNLGCGDCPVRGAVNVDLRAGDVVADARGLPFRDGVFNHVAASDVLEHFPRDRFPALMAEIGRVAAPGAWLTVRVPNMEALAVSDRQARHVIEGYVRNIYGGHRWGPDGAWDTHHWGWTPGTLTADLAEHGWDVVSNDRDLNMTVEAVAA